MTFNFILNYSICMRGWGTVRFWMETNDLKKKIAAENQRRE